MSLSLENEAYLIIIRLTQKKHFYTYSVPLYYTYDPSPPPPKQRQIPNYYYIIALYSISY